MTHHDGTDHDPEAQDTTEGATAAPQVSPEAHAPHSEAAEEQVTDYVDPVDHGDGASAAAPTTETEENDYVDPVDHG